VVKSSKLEKKKKERKKEAEEREEEEEAEAKKKKHTLPNSSAISQIFWNKVCDIEMERNLFWVWRNFKHQIFLAFVTTEQRQRDCCVEIRSSSWHSSSNNGGNMHCIHTHKRKWLSGEPLGHILSMHVRLLVEKLSVFIATVAAAAAASTAPLVPHP
jgi:hypothetical protein